MRQGRNRTPTRAVRMQTFSVHARNPDARFTIATNRGTDQEVSALALHLVQASLVYVNTRMVQSVLGDLGWAARLSSDDLRGLETVIYTHINPYLWPLRGRSRPAHRLQEKGWMSVIMGILIVTCRMNTPRWRFAVHFEWFTG